MEEQTALAKEDRKPPGAPAPARGATTGPAASIATRTLVGAALVALVAGVLLLDHLWRDGRAVALVGALLVGTGLWEYCRIAERAAGAALSRPLLVAGGLALFLSQWAAWAYGYSPWQAAVAVLCLASLGSLVVKVLKDSVEGGLQAAGLTAMGLIYVPLSFSFILAIRARWSLGALITVLAVCKVTDTGAYYAGTLIGGPKLAPRIAPRKTVAGAAGGVAAATGLSLLLSLTGVSVVAGPLLGVLYGLLLGGVAVVGDLAESMLKRQAALKDSGRLLPGQGGALDMIDDLLFAAPLSYLFFSIVARGT